MHVYWGLQWQWRNSWHFFVESENKFPQ